MATPQRLAIKHTQALEALTERITALEAQVAALVALLEKQQPVPAARKAKASGTDD